MRKGSRTLGEFPLNVVRIDCQRCRRAQIAEPLRTLARINPQPAKFSGAKKLSLPAAATRAVANWRVTLKTGINH